MVTCLNHGDGVGGREGGVLHSVGEGGRGGGGWSKTRKRGEDPKVSLYSRVGS